MTPAERAALRELVARTVDTVLYSYEDTKRIREALPKLLDDCDRLERENDTLRLWHEEEAKVAAETAEKRRGLLAVIANSGPVLVGGAELAHLLKENERLTRERDEARELVRNWEDMDTVAWDAVCRWDAEDAQAKKEGGG